MARFSIVILSVLLFVSSKTDVRVDSLSVSSSSSTIKNDGCSTSSLKMASSDGMKESDTSSGTMISEFCQSWAELNASDIKLQASNRNTEAGEFQMWRRCVRWGVNPMPYRLVAVDTRNNQVIGASYYNDSGFLSALAVLPEYRGRKIGKLLVAATLSHMVRDLNVDAKNINLDVMGIDASDDLHAFYRKCGFRSNNGDKAAVEGGDYKFADFKGLERYGVRKIDEYVMNSSQARDP